MTPDNRKIKGERVENGFVLPPEVQSASTLTVVFRVKGKELKFADVENSQFDAKWTIGLHLKPYSSRLVLPDYPQDPDLVYYVWWNRGTRKTEGRLVSTKFSNK
jgi:hypothetical protein